MLVNGKRSPEADALMYPAICMCRPNLVIEPPQLTYAAPPVSLGEFRLTWEQVLGTRVLMRHVSSSVISCVFRRDGTRRSG